MANDEQRSTTPNHEQDTGDERSARDSPSPDTDKGKGKMTSQPESADEEEQEKPGDSSKSSVEASPEADAGASGAQHWQAIYAPEYNAYYFYNSQTGETTWTNPLQPSDSASSGIPPSVPSASSDVTSSELEPASASTSQYTALQAAALAQGIDPSLAQGIDPSLAQGIDPSLAHLDPSLLTATTSASGGPIPSFQAKFNARTGAFARPDARTPGHLSEYERMKRMSEFYFDVNAWEQELAQEDAQGEEGNGKKRKRLTKKDLERFKEQKRLKKIAKTAWLRT